MARNFTLKPLAATIALSLGLVGCGSDNDGAPVVETESRTMSANFTTQLSGVAVKGTMAHAHVMVEKIAADGSREAVPFRIAESASAESYSITVAKGTSTDVSNAELMKMVLAKNPADYTTSDTGNYAIFLEDSFAGSVVVTVTAKASGDSSIIRCDAYDGCGSYSDGDAPQLPNNGDLVIDFGEWYKDDLSLSVVKVIDAPSSNARSANGRSFIGNITALTQMVANSVLGNGSAPTSSDIANASFNTLAQLLGTDTSTLSNLLSLAGDVSTGAATDLAGISADQNLNNDIMSLLIVTSSLQGVAGKSGESLNQLLTDVSASLKDGTFNSTDSTLKARVQSAVTTASNLFTQAATAIANGQTVSPSDPLYALVQSLQSAIDQGITSATEITSVAEAVSTQLEQIGCTSACDTTGINYDAINTALLTDINRTENDVDATKIKVDASQESTALAKAKKPSTTPVTEQDAKAYYEAALIAYNLAYDAKGNDKFTTSSKVLSSQAQGWVAAAAELNKKDSTKYSATLTKANSVNSKAAALVGAATTAAADAKAVLTDAEQVLGSVIGNAGLKREKAVAAVAAANTAESASTTAYNDANGSYSAAMDASNPQTLEQAKQFLAAAELALSNELTFFAAAPEFKSFADTAVSEANAFAAAATSDADKTLAQGLLSDATALRELAALHVTLANETTNGKTRLQLRRELLAKAQNNIPTYEKLDYAQTTTQAFADMNFITVAGRDSLEMIAEIMNEVIDEASTKGGSVENQKSVMHPTWTYSFDEEKMTISGSNTDNGSTFSANLVFSEVSESATVTNTNVIASWGATIYDSADGGTGAKLMFAGGNDADMTAQCATYAASATAEGVMGSCMVFKFPEANKTIDDLSGKRALTSKSHNTLMVTDGDGVGFDGAISHMHDETVAGVTSGHIMMDGKSGMLDFTLKVEGVETDLGNGMYTDTATVHLWIAGDMGYHLMASAKDGADLMGDIKLGTTKFADVKEILYGMEATWTPGGLVTTYTNLDFTKR